MERVNFNWLFATESTISLLLYNESDEDAFIQEIFFINPMDSSRLYVNRFNRRPVIPKSAITPYEINVFGQELKDIIHDSESLTLWIYWRTADNEYTYPLTFCNDGCIYTYDRLSPLLTSFNESTELSVITDIYFGKDTPDGPVTETSWKNFKDSVVSKHFGAYTEFTATGSWTAENGKLINENTSVIRIIHSPEGENFDRVHEIAMTYKLRFRQESVLVTRTDYAQTEFK